MASIEELSIDIVSNLGNSDKALDRLSASLSKMSAALGGFDAGKFSAIGNGVGNLAVSMKSASGIKATDFSRIANGISKLNKADVSNLAAVGRGLSSLLVGFQGLSGVADGARNLATAASSIAKIGGVKVQAAINNMTNMGPAVAALNNAFAGGIAPLPNISEFVSSIAKLGGKATTNAITNLPQLANSLTQTMNTLSKAPKVSQNVISLTNALANLASQGSKARTAANGLSTAMDKVSTSGRRASIGILSFGTAIKSMLASAGIILGIYQIIQFGKSCIELGSSMTETQNVVDVAFGSMASKANAFAKTTATQFGVSELSAKKYSGVLMSMYRSLGVAQENAANMAMGLTGRAGDIASFYNISTDDAYYKIRSAVSGETEPMKQLGVNMNVANLNAFALSNGFGKLYNKMTLAEQAMLRYQYIMATTDQTAGDFVRTQGSFANQLRILQLQFQQFSTTMGQGFINIIVHVVRALNTLLAYLQTVANAFRALTALIFGDNSAQAGGGIAGGIEDAEDAAGGLAGNLGGAAQAAKDLANATSGIDELNIISPQDKGGSGGGGAGTGGADVDYGDLNSGTSFVDDLNGKFSELLNLLEPTTTALKKLWDEGFSKLKDFTFGTLQDFYDNFLKPVGLWTLSEDGLPRFINITNDMLNRINWTRLQDSLRSFYEQLGNLAILTFTTLLDFYEEFLVPIAVWTIGDALPRLLDVLTNLAKSINWDNLVGSLKNLYGALSYFTIGIGEGLVLFIEGMARALTPVISDAIDLLSLALNGIANTIKLIPEETLIAIGGAIGGIVTAILLFNGATAAVTAISSATRALSGLIAIATANPILVAATAIFGISGAMSALQESAANNSAIGQFASALKDLADDVDKKNESLRQSLEESEAYVSKAGIAEANMARDLANEYNDLAKKADISATDQDRMRKIVEQLTEIVPELSGYVNDQTGLLENQSGVLETLINKMESYAKMQAAEEMLKEGYKQQIEALENLNAVQERSNSLLNETSVKMGISKAEADNLINSQNGLTEAYELWRRAPQKFKDKYGMGYAELELAVNDAKAAQEEYNQKVQEAQAVFSETGTHIENMKRYVNEYQREINSLDYTEALQKSSDAIDDLHGIWGIDGAQILGSDALLIQQEIEKGLTPDEDGWYVLSNGAMVRYGDGITDFIPIAQSITEDLTGKVESVLLGLKSKGYDGGKDIVGGLEEGIINNQDDTSGVIETWVNSFVGRFKNILGIHSPSTVFSDFAKNIIDGFNGGVTDNQSIPQGAIESWASNIGSWFKAKLQVNDKNTSTMFADIASGIIESFNSKVDGDYKLSQKPMITWAENVRRWFVGDDESQGVNALSWTKFADAIVVAFYNKIDTSHLETQEPMETWAQNVREWFWGDSDINGTGGMYDSFYNMAKRINEGFAEGIHKFSYLAKDAIRQWARDAMKEAEEEFEIESPSKRFYRMAAYDIEGFNNAFADLGGTTQSAINKWASAINAPSIGLGFNIDDSYSKYVPNYGQDFSIGYQTIMGKVGGQVSVSSDGRDNIILEAINNVIDGKLMPVLRNLEKLDNLESMSEQNELLQEIADKDTTVNLNGRKVNEELTRTTRRGGFKFRPT